MEDENDLMSMFNSDMELSYEDFIIPQEVDEEIDNNGSDADPEKNTNSVEDDNPEGVDREEEDDNSEGDESADDNSPNIYSSLSNVLYEQGLLPSLESSELLKDVTNIDDFTTILKKEIDVQADLKAEERLANLDLEKIATSRRAVIELDSIDEDYLKDNLDVAKDIIYRDYLNQGLSEDRAKKMLRKTIDLGEDTIIEDALESKESLKVFESKQESIERDRYKQEVEHQKIEQEKIDNSIKDYIFKSKEIVKGVPNTKALQDSVFKAMTEVVSKNPITGDLENKLMKQRSENPIEFDTKMYYVFELTNGFTDLSKLTTTTTSKAVKTLEKQLRTTSFQDNGAPTYLQDPNSYGGIGPELVF